MSSGTQADLDWAVTDVSDGGSAGAATGAGGANGAGVGAGAADARFLSDEEILGIEPVAASGQRDTSGN